jgi:hypothetical protein
LFSDVRRRTTVCDRKRQVGNGAQRCVVMHNSSEKMCNCIWDGWLCAVRHIQSVDMQWSVWTHKIWDMKQQWTLCKKGKRQKSARWVTACRKRTITCAWWWETWCNGWMALLHPWVLLIIRALTKNQSEWTQAIVHMPVWKEALCGECLQDTAINGGWFETIWRSFTTTGRRGGNFQQAKCLVEWWSLTAQQVWSCFESQPKHRKLVWSGLVGKKLSMKPLGWLWRTRQRIINTENETGLQPAGNLWSSRSDVLNTAGIGLQNSTWTSDWTLATAETVCQISKLK